MTERERLVGEVRKDLFPDNGEDTYWRLLQELPIVNAIGVLALINSILAVTPSDRSAHEILNQPFLEPGLAERVTGNAPAAPAPRGATRPSGLWCEPGLATGASAHANRLAGLMRERLCRARCGPDALPDQASAC